MPLVFPTKYSKGYPENDDDHAASASMGEILATRYSSDAHYAGYEADIVRRHSKKLFEDPQHADKIPAVNVRMTHAVFDVDAPGHACTDAWRAMEQAKVAEVRAEHPGLFAHETKGGYRLVGALPEAYPLRSHADAEAWRVLYLTWTRYLRRRFGVASDVACAQWTRLYRAPHVVRDGAAEDRPIVGNPHAIGMWAPKTTKRDRDVPTRLAPTSYGAVEPVPMSDPENAYGMWRIEDAVRFLSTAPLVCFTTSGQSRRDEMFRICAILVRRMRLPVEVAGDLLEEVYNPRLAKVGFSQWNRFSPGDYGMSLDERLSQARETGSIPEGIVMDEDMWNTLNRVAS